MMWDGMNWEKNYSLPCNCHRVNPVTLSLGILNNEHMSNRKMENVYIEYHVVSIGHNVPDVWHDLFHEMHYLLERSEINSNLEILN